MNLISDIIIYIITFYILVQLDLFERNTKNDMIFIGKNFAIYVITYQIISYLIKHFTPIKEGHETPCTIVYGEPGTDINNWPTANLSSIQREENNCNYNLETETWDSNPLNPNNTDRTICACKPDGGHRHFGDELESIMHCFEPEEELNMIFTGENTRGNDNFDIQAVCQDGYETSDDLEIDVSCPYPGGSDYTIQGECVEILCQAPDNIDDIVIQGDLTPSSFSATGQCPPGFEGDVTISGCEIGGTPYTIDNNCVEQQCISPTNLGIIDPTTITETDLYRSTWDVTASCPDGYSGTPTITECSIGGTEYTIDDSSCIPNLDCGGTWSTCSAACESGADRTYTVTQPQSGDGAACPAQGEDCQPGEGECPEMCLTPSNIPNIDVQETDISRISFSAMAQCSDGYTGSLTVSPCSAHDEEYQIQGECVQNLDTSSLPDLTWVFSLPEDALVNNDCNTVCERIEGGGSYTCANPEDWPEIMTDGNWTQGSSLSNWRAEAETAYNLQEIDSLPRFINDRVNKQPYSYLGDKTSISQLNATLTTGSTFQKGLRPGESVGVPSNRDPPGPGLWSQYFNQDAYSQDIRIIPSNRFGRGTAEQFTPNCEATSYRARGFNDYLRMCYCQKS